jgi:hypothetical protein
MNKFGQSEVQVYNNNNDDNIEEKNNDNDVINTSNHLISKGYLVNSIKKLNDDIILRLDHIKNDSFNLINFVKVDMEKSFTFEDSLLRKQIEDLRNDLVQMKTEMKNLQTAILHHHPHYRF